MPCSSFRGESSLGGFCDAKARREEQSEAQRRRADADATRMGRLSPGGDESMKDGLRLGLVVDHSHRRQVPSIGHPPSTAWCRFHRPPRPPPLAIRTHARSTRSSLSTHTLSDHHHPSPIVLHPSLLPIHRSRSPNPAHRSAPSEASAPLHTSSLPPPPSKLELATPSPPVLQLRKHTVRISRQPPCRCIDAPLHHGSHASSQPRQAAA